MRLVSRRVFGLSLVVCAAIADAAPAHAQNFFQQLFGFAAPAAEPQRSPQQPTTPGGRAYSFPANSSLVNRRPSHEDEADERQSKGPNYRTVCVRMCDGYYFPVSNSTTKKGFYRDQNKCSATCGQEARLFHLPANAMDIDQAVDQQGRVYGYLPVAYKYRKALVAGCQCKPDPWSEAELARHQQYADAEAAKAPAKPVLAEAPGDAAMSGVGSASSVTTSTDDLPAPHAPTAIPVKLVKAAPTKPRPALVAHKGPPQTSHARPQTSGNSGVNFSGGMGLGGGQLSWPGDTSQRR
jgi:hypothetical protein